LLVPVFTRTQFELIQPDPNFGRTSPELIRQLQREGFAIDR
jgi:hypothetical protein